MKLWCWYLIKDRVWRESSSGIKKPGELFFDCKKIQSDASGLLHSSTDAGGTISYVYNPEDKIKQITSPSGNTVIGYDDYGYQSSLEDIDAGTIEYTYNAFGEL